MFDIKQLIKKGESKTIEFKEKLPDGNNIAKTVVAFSNMAGGKIIIGVKDRTDKIIGISAHEALVNAVTHRDYSISGSDIKFAIFDDKIEITSPGALPRSLEIEDIIRGRSEIRNKVIARFFNEIDFIEQWGVGIRKMIRLMRQNGLSEPQFRESGLFFKVILSKTRTFEKAAAKTERILPITNTSTSTSSSSNSKVVSKLIELIKKNPHLKLKELADHLNMTVHGVRFHLKKLKQKGILKRIGSPKDGSWLIDEDFNYHH